MKYLNKNIEFYPFIVNFSFYYNLKNLKFNELVHKTQLTEDKYIDKISYEIPLSKELSEKFNLKNVIVMNLENKNFNCWAACNINNEEVFNYIKNIIL